MFNRNDILETVNMISQENLDIRTITMGISLRDCASDSRRVVEQRIYDKITRYAQNLVKTGKQLKRILEFPLLIKEYQSRQYQLWQKAVMRTTLPFMQRCWIMQQRLLVLIL